MAVRKAKSNSATLNVAGRCIHSTRLVRHTKLFRILLVSGAQEDYDALRAIPNDPLCRLARIGTCEEAIACLSRKPVPWRFTRNNGITEGVHNKMELINRQAWDPGLAPVVGVEPK